MEALTLDTDNIPSHIAIIMDGNGRWAKKRFLNKSAGHKAGAQTLKKLCTDAEKMGVNYLTVYAFSTENWNRSKEEIDNLMDLLRGYIQQYIDDSKKNSMRLKVIGRRDRIPEDLASKIVYLEQLTAEKTGLTLVIALDYGSQDEITRAIKQISLDALSGTIKTTDIDETLINSYLDTSELPQPDLLIRTSGELRLSNFLLWQLAYCELYFTDKLWPDFDKNDLAKAIEQYRTRERRFGKRL